MKCGYVSPIRGVKCDEEATTYALMHKPGFRVHAFARCDFHAIPNGNGKFVTTITEQEFVVYLTHDE